MTPIQILSDRVISAFPISIGTSLALESIFDGRLPPFDPERPIPQKIDITKYDYHYFNIKTLVRNIFGSVSNLKTLFLDPKSIAETLLEEVELIKDIYFTEGSGSCKPIFYITDLKRLTTLASSGVNIRLPKTDKQIAEDNLLKRTLQEFFKLYYGQTDLLIFDHKIKGRGKVIITTHMAIELLNRKNFSQFDLLESHTGRLKTRKDWYTKYHKVGKEPMFMLPWQEKLLYIFGDNTVIIPKSITIRKQILDIAIETNWNPLTTEDKVKFYLSKNNEIKKLYNDLPKVF